MERRSAAKLPAGAGLSGNLRGFFQPAPAGQAGDKPKANNEMTAPEGESCDTVIHAMSHGMAAPHSSQTPSYAAL